MIRYALLCQKCDHEFESWFAGSNAFDTLKSDGNVTCPSCDSDRVEKQIMAPSVRTRSKTVDADTPASMFKDLQKKVREHIAESFDYVGSGFADEARAMHYGEVESRPIWGQTTSAESKALNDEGVEASPLPDEFTPPKPPSDKTLN